jgi:DNA-binding transcriptional ArsR family regulator
MKEGPDLSRVASLIGDPARANMLTALMSGRALTASELAHEAGVTLPTASSHLAKLEHGGLVAPRKQGRHKYFSLAREDVAQALEGLMGIAAGAGHMRTRTGPQDGALRKARVCYNHLAGEMGTRLYDSLMARRLLRKNGEGLALTKAGEAFVGALGIDIEMLHRNRAPLCRECLDWSERKSHLAGSLGRALLTHIEAVGWARRDAATRVVTFSAKGEKQFEAQLLR